MIIKSMIKRNNVERYINLIKIESIESIEFNLFIFFTIKIDVINLTNLSIEKQRDFAILRKDYFNKIRKYKKKSML